VRKDHKNFTHVEGKSSELQQGCTLLPSSVCGTGRTAAEVLSPILMSAGEPVLTNWVRMKRTVTIKRERGK